MTSTLASSPIVAGVQPITVASRASPAFDLSLGRLSTSPTVSPGTFTTPQFTAGINTKGAPMTLPGKTTLSAATSGTPASIAQLLAGEDQTASNETPTAQSVAWPITPMQMAANATARKTVLTELQLQPAICADNKARAVIAGSDDLLTDKAKDAPTTDTVVASSADVPLAMPMLATHTITPQLAAKATVPTSARTSPMCAKDGEIESAVAAGPFPTASGEKYAGRQIATSVSAGEGLLKTATTSVIEPPSKSDAFEAAISFSNTSTLSADMRNITGPAVFGLGELSGAQGVAERHLNLARDTLWLDQLATDIISASGQTDRISFRLTPAHLGQLDVDLLTSNAGLTVNIATSTEEAGKIVTAAQTTLVDSLQAQGIRVADTQITSGNDTSYNGQSQRQHTAHHLIETALASLEEPDLQDSERPDGRFA